MPHKPLRPQLSLAEILEDTSSESKDDHDVEQKIATEILHAAFCLAVDVQQKAGECEK